MSQPILFEACVEGVDGVLAAAEGGAARAELCSSLTEGGLTPSLGIVEAALERSQIPLMVMVRPRGGDFRYTEAEFDGMLRDVAGFRQMRGLHGVVFGMLSPNGDIDRERTARLREAAGPQLEVTFHRAFDVSRDPAASLQTLIELGVDRVLSSGQAATAPEGAALLSALVEQAAGSISIMPGCGIEPEHVRSLVAQTGVREVHATAFRLLESPMQHRNPAVYMGVEGLPEYSRHVTDAERVRAYVQACLAAAPTAGA